MKPAIGIGTDATGAKAAIIDSYIYRAQTPPTLER
jgi:hypothetical protein